MINLILQNPLGGKYNREYTFKDGEPLPKNQYGEIQHMPFHFVLPPDINHEEVYMSFRGNTGFELLAVPCKVVLLKLSGPELNLVRDHMYNVPFYRSADNSCIWTGEMAEFILIGIHSIQNRSTQ